MPLLAVHLQAPGLRLSWIQGRRSTRATRSSGCRTCAGGHLLVAANWWVCSASTAPVAASSTACCQFLSLSIQLPINLAAHPPPPTSCLALCSYQCMGTALIECKSGCTCEPTKLDGTWNRRASLFWSTRVFVSCTLCHAVQHGSCCQSAVACLAQCNVRLLGCCRDRSSAGLCAACLACTADPLKPVSNAPLQVSRHPQCLIRVTVLPDAGEFPQEGHKVSHWC